MKDIAISIIIPIYNVEKYLDTCLKSVQNQTFKNFEVICIDDGSNDKSLGILERYAKNDKRFTVMQQSHKGAGSARNLGISLANGKYIQFLDSDDYFEPNLLDELYKRAEKYKADLVVCSCRKVDEFGNITETGNPNNPINLIKTPLEKPINKKDFPHDIFSLFTPMPWNKLYLKSLIKDNNIIFPELKLYEDITFVHSVVISANRIIAFNKELINYRYNRNGSLAKLRSSNVSEMVKACQLLKDFLVSKDLYAQYKYSYLNAFKNHIRSEISLCNEEEYTKFLADFKLIMAEDWEFFMPVLNQNHISADYLSNIIGNNKVVLWGASLFIQNILSKNGTRIPQIIGIVDKNKSLWGRTVCGYKVFSPEELNKLKPDGVIMTIWSDNEGIYKNLQEEFRINYPDITLFPNIFDSKISDIDIQKQGVLN